MSEPTWLKHLTPEWRAWREKQILKGRDPDSYIKQKLREDGLLSDEDEGSQVLTRPHTIDWFRALEESDPAQAAHTRAVIRKAGREDVCSVCGDQDSADYKLIGSDLITIRLCSDCQAIRATLHGETFTPL